MSSGLFLFHPIKHSLKAKLHMQKLKDSEWYRQFSRAQQHFATALKAEGQGNAAESGRIRGKNGARTPQERRKNGASKTQERRKNRIVRPHSRLFQPEFNRCVHGRLLSSAALCRARQVASTSRLEVETHVVTLRDAMLPGDDGLLLPLLHKWHDGCALFRV